MSRWEPDATGRMVAAALDLYETRGYESTTATDIAIRAGVTERTFFRHFSDKREVLFAGSSDLENLILQGIADAGDVPALDMALNAYRTAAPIFETTRDFIVRRARVVLDNPNLRERELLKMHSLAVVIRNAMIDRGVPPTASAVAAECATSVFTIAFEKWIDGAESEGLILAIESVARELKSIADEFQVE
ncbi:TetR/AcrR family transcriptional regulator [Nonomuraea endophytica]|uniref:TetR/AcrR family transcriptional regulator n=1 Tax=Nonomuraea endophytica TaxID=714136 RepID=UPI0037CC8C7B